jgi:hypothetical protein
MSTLRSRLSDQGSPSVKASEGDDPAPSMNRFSMNDFSQPSSLVHLGFTQPFEMDDDDDLKLETSRPSSTSVPVLPGFPPPPAPVVASESKKKLLPLRISKDDTFAKKQVEDSSSPKVSASGGYATISSPRGRKSKVARKLTDEALERIAETTPDHLVVLVYVAIGAPLELRVPWRGGAKASASTPSASAGSGSSSQAAAAPPSGGTLTVGEIKNRVWKFYYDRERVQFDEIRLQDMKAESEIVSRASKDEHVFRLHGSEVYLRDSYSLKRVLRSWKLFREINPVDHPLKTSPNFLVLDLVTKKDMGDKSNRQVRLLPFLRYCLMLCSRAKLQIQWIQSQWRVT